MNRTQTKTETGQRTARITLRIAALVLLPLAGCASLGETPPEGLRSHRQLGAGRRCERRAAAARAAANGGTSRARRGAGPAAVRGHR